MTHKVHVSVVIPVYDRLEVLERALRFFEFQTYPKSLFEVVIVDDGSPTAIDKTISRTSWRFNHRIVRQDNHGRASARNTGVDRAQGSLIIFSDADRLPSPLFVAEHVAFHERWAGAACVGVPWDCFLMWDKLREFGEEGLPTMKRYSRRPLYHQLFSRLLPLERCTSHVSWAGFLVGNSSLAKGVLQKVGGFDERLKSWGIEHFELAWRLRQQCGTEVRFMGLAESFHVPHLRDRGYFVAGIDDCIAALADAPSAGAMGQLRKFMLGEISLQELERQYLDSGSPEPRYSEALFYDALRSAPNVITGSVSEKGQIRA